MLLAEQMRGVGGGGPVLQPPRQVIKQKKAFGLKQTSVPRSVTRTVRNWVLIGPDQYENKLILQWRNMDDERCLICGITAHVFGSGLRVVLDWLSLDKVPHAPAGGCEFDCSVYIKARCHGMRV